jgi:hypothetical protein
MTGVDPKPAPSVKPLRSFGFLVGGAFALLGVWPRLVHGAPWRLWALAAAALLVVPAVVAPRLLAPVQRAWMRVGRMLGFINTRIILGAAFYLVFTPIGTVMRWCGWDPLGHRFDREAASYRIPRAPRPGEHMRRQF